MKRFFRPARRALSGSAALFSLLAITPASSQTASAPVPADSQDTSRAAIARDIEAEIAAGRLTGVSLALVSHGRILWEQGFGWADREARRPATPATPFSLASTTKTFTTAAMMTLVRTGKLDLDAPANRYLAPDRFTDDAGLADTATLRRLATHSSGAPTFFLMYPEGGDIRQPSVARLLRDYGHLVAPPGERYEYSNLGMAVLAEIVARRSGEPIGVYLREKLLDPLGMKNSFFDTDVARRPEMAVRYADDGARLPFYLTATPGSGEMYASAHDLALWAMFHLEDAHHGGPLDNAALDLLHKPATRIDANDFYGMGWMIRNAPGEPLVLSHGGGQSGVKAEFVLLPGSDVAAIVLSNRHSDQPFVEGVRDRLIRSVVPDWRGIPVENSQAQPLTAGYVGTWQGTLSAQGRQVPVRLMITGERAGTLAVGDGPGQTITDLGIVDGALSGDTEGTIDIPDAQREKLGNIALNLRLRGDVIDGETIAWAKTGSRMAVLPFWTRLTRQ